MFLNGCTAVGIGLGHLVDIQNANLLEVPLDKVRELCQPDQMIVVHLQNGEVVDGRFIQLNADSTVHVYLYWEDGDSLNTVQTRFLLQPDHYDLYDSYYWIDLERVCAIPTAEITHITILEKGRGTRWAFGIVGAVIDTAFILMIVSLNNIGVAAD
ncbi:hypothetical protein ACFLQV_01160 [Calditrichota bacterium]